MKSLKTIGLTIILVTILFGCEEVKDPAGRRDIGVVPLISDVSGIFISGESGSFIQFTVELASGTTVDNGEIEVSRQDNFERVKIADLTTFPSTFTFTLGQIAEKLGEINAGDIIYIEVVTTKNGISTRSNAALSLIVFCEYDNALAVGSYHSVSADWATEGDIVLTADPSDQYTVYVSGLETIDGVNEDLGPLVMHIDPVTFVVTADKTVLATETWWGDTNIAYEGTGLFNSCTGNYTMNFHITVDGGDYGVNAFTFTRN